MQPIFFLTGPTAVGKTALALELVSRQGGEILSCDATNFYKGMDIGTAKPTAEEQLRVVHHGVDCADFSSIFDIEQYLELAKSVVESLQAKNKPLWVIGGSGFYLKSFFHPVVDEIKVSKDVQDFVKNLYETENLAGCLKLLKEHSPEGFGKLDIHNPRRVLKALERVLASGKTLHELEQMWMQMKSPFEAYPKHLILLNRSTEDLSVRITQRVDQMIQSGLIEEVAQLDAIGLSTHPVSSKTIGYRETLAYLKNEVNSLEALKAMIIQNTLHLVKKQRTFFRHQIPVDKEIFLNPNEEGIDYLAELL